MSEQSLPEKLRIANKAFATMGYDLLMCVEAAAIQTGESDHT